MRLPRLLSLIALSAVLVLAGCAGAQKPASGQTAAGLETREQSFDEFLDVFRKDALAAGIRKATLDTAFDGHGNLRRASVVGHQDELIV